MALFYPHDCQTANSVHASNWPKWCSLSEPWTPWTMASMVWDFRLGCTVGRRSTMWFWPKKIQQLIHPNGRLIGDLVFPQHFSLFKRWRPNSIHYVYIYIHTYIHICACVIIYICHCMYVRMYVCLSVMIYIYIYIYAIIYISLYIHVIICLYIYIYVIIYIYVCVCRVFICHYIYMSF